MNVLRIAVLLGVLAGLLVAVFPASAAPSACGAVHGAFNSHNSVYGQPGTPGGVSDSNNSSYFGQAGGSAGYNGAVGQEPGATGYNNSNTGCQN
jgi:hypothetical protein